MQRTLAGCPDSGACPPRRYRSALVPTLLILGRVGTGRYTVIDIDVSVFFAHLGADLLGVNDRFLAHPHLLDCHGLGADNRTFLAKGDLLDLLAGIGDRRAGRVPGDGRALDDQFLLGHRDVDCLGVGGGVFSQPRATCLDGFLPRHNPFLGERHGLLGVAGTVHVGVYARGLVRNILRRAPSGGGLRGIAARPNQASGDARAVLDDLDRCPVADREAARLVRSDVVGGALLTAACPGSIWPASE